MRTMTGPKTGKTYVVQSVADLMAAAECGDGIGYCIFCGNDQSGVEPDARKYECEACDRPGVYGAEQLVLMGLCHE